MRVLVCGGRDFKDRDQLFGVLDRYHALRGPFVLVIHGAYRGADTLADEWALARGVKVARYPADWTAFGRRAGPLRNQRMIDEGRPDFVIAFSGGDGTTDMIERARSACVRGVRIAARDTPP